MARPGEIVLVVALLALVGVGAYELTAPDPEVVDWESWSASEDGRTITLRYHGTSCDDEADVEVEEEQQRVLLTLRVTSERDGCDDSVPKTIDVRLSDPLGQRTVAHG